MPFMTIDPVPSVFDELDQRLIAALQCDGRATAEHVAQALGVSTRVVQRRLAALFGDGAVRVVGVPPVASVDAAMLLDVRVLRGRTDAVAAALAARADIPLIDVSAGGDRINALLLADPAEEHRLVFRQLPATSAITEVDAQNVLHVFAYASQWRLDVLTEDERSALQTAPTPGPPFAAAPEDPLDRDLVAALADAARRPAAALARRVARPESTVRRRLAALTAQGRLATEVVVDPRRLGLAVDANLRIRVLPKALDRVGRTLAAHPAHGAVATTGVANLYVAVWLKDLDHLYRFITRDLADLDVGFVDTMLVGRSVKRPGRARANR